MTTVCLVNVRPKKGFFSTTFLKLLEKRLPRRFKRLIYVSSILGLIQQMKDPDMALVIKLNTMFKLANNPDALAFPMYIKSVIWKDVMLEAVCISTTDEQVPITALLDQELNSKDCTAIGEYFARQAPAWLKYGAIDTMVNDIVLLVKQLKQFNTNSKFAALS